MQDFCLKILREKDQPTLPPPEDRHIKIAIAAFDGKSIGDIRVDFPRTSIPTIAESIRKTRDAMRRGQSPELVKEQFPALVQEQKAYKNGGKSAKKSAIMKAVDTAVVSLQHFKASSFREFIETCKERFGPLAVPLTMQKIVEGVEGGDKDMIKLSTEVFSMNPRKGGINQQFNFPPPGASNEPKRTSNPERRTVFFEEIVRRNRKRLDGDVQAVDVAVIDPEEGDDA